MAKKTPFDGDHYTKPGAERLAERIVSYWHSRGFRDVTATVYKIMASTGLCYGIRSNLVNGLPPRRFRR